jgi:uncharacterized protein
MDRLPWLEDPGKDFPFYTGVPAWLTARQWAVVMASVVAALLLLNTPIHWPGGAIGSFIPAFLLAGLPLLALAWVAPRDWPCLFAPVHRRELRLMLGFALLNILVSIGVGIMVSAFTPVAANGRIAELANLDTWGLVAFFAKTAPQLLGEEVITMLPFLALLTWLTHRVGLSRKAAVLGAWLTTAVLFGLIHLPTYNWNWMQCLVVIGTARLVLTLPWMLTKNLWVPTGAHILNDWLLFGMTLLGASLSGQP